MVPVVSPLYVPATHMVHTAAIEAPDTTLYAPAVHAVHAEVPLVSALYEPTAHAVHAVVPVVNPLYVPARHAVHAKEVDAAGTLP